MLEPPDRLREDLPPPKDSAVRTVADVKRQQSKDTLRLNEVIRKWQSDRLASEHSMVSLPPLQINKAGLAQTFEHNIVATYVTYPCHQFKS
jgi:histone deacetylase 6